MEKETYDEFRNELGELLNKYNVTTKEFFSFCFGSIHNILSDIGQNQHIKIGDMEVIYHARGKQ